MDKETAERLTRTETKLIEAIERIDGLEKVNEERKNWVWRQMLGLLKIVLGVTVLTFLTEMAKEGCRTCKIIIAYLTGGQA